MVVTDEYSRYPVVCVIKSKAATAVIPHLKEVFKRYGTPIQVTTDHSLPLQSEEFAQLAKEQCFYHKRTTPRRLTATTNVQCFAQPLMQTLRTKTWEANLIDFLRGYRDTPHPATGQTPASILLGKRSQTSPPKFNPKFDAPDVTAKDCRSKAQVQADINEVLATQIPRRKRRSARTTRATFFKKLFTNSIKPPSYKNC
jgi:hypothetical protein